MAERYRRIRISGDVGERSVEYGREARAEIHHTRRGYEQAFLAKGVTWARATEIAREYLPVLQERLPQLVAEIEGIAAGSGLPVDDILAMNCRTEILWRAAATSAAGITSATHFAECSSFALEPDRTAAGASLVGQNWDWLDVLADGVVVLEVDRPDGPNYVTIVEAGLLGKTALTGAGLALGINTLASSVDGGPGVPFHFLIRAAIDCAHAADVVELLASLPRASSGNFVVGTADGAVLNIETGAGDARTVQPVIAENGAVVHTNHFVRQPVGAYDLAPLAMADSFVRYGRMTRLIASRLEPLEIQELQSALADHADAPSGVCCHPDERSPRAAQWATLFGAILNPARRELHVAEGNPCETPWVRYDYSGLLSS